MAQGKHLPATDVSQVRRCGSCVGGGSFAWLLASVELRSSKGDLTLRKNWLSGLLVAAVLLGAAGCGGGEVDKDASGSDSTAAAQEDRTGAAAAEADLDGVPEVVAEVNGEEIGKNELAEAYEIQLRQVQSQGAKQQVDEEQLRKQVLDGMVSTELLVQEAHERGFSAADREVAQTLEGLAERNGLESSDAFLVALGEQGMDADMVRSEIRTQLEVEQLVADEAGDLQPTDAEVRALYDQLVAQQRAASAGGDAQVPPLRQVRPRLEGQLRSHKESEVAKKLIAELRDDADIVIHL